jgi:hypothetical protein
MPPRGSRPRFAWETPSGTPPSSADRCADLMTCLDGSARRISTSPAWWEAAVKG